MALQTDAAEAKTLKERGSVYGDHHQGGTNVGKMWAGVLSQHYGKDLPPLPADIVDLMMVIVKVARVSQPRGRGHEDSYHDARVYLGMGKESADRLKEEGDHP